MVHKRPKSAIDCPKISQIIPKCARKSLLRKGLRIDICAQTYTNRRMAKAFHDRASIEKTLRTISLISGEIKAVLKLLEGDPEEGTKPFEGRLYIQGESELVRSMKRLPLWVKHARGEALKAMLDHDDYIHRTEREAAEAKDKPDSDLEDELAQKKKAGGGRKKKANLKITGE